MASSLTASGFEIPPILKVAPVPTPIDVTLVLTPYLNNECPNSFKPLVRSMADPPTVRDNLTPVVFD